jgi:autotransporter translocation and assembly factor TamB
LRKLSFAVGVALLALFVLAGVFFTILHSSWGREKVLTSLTSALQESGWKLNAESSSGTPFEKMELRGITLESPEGDFITIGSLKTNLSSIRLLKKEIAFQEFQADDVHWILSPIESETVASPVSTKGIPFALVFSNLRLTNVSLPESESLATVRGSLRVSRYNRRVRLHLNATKHDAPSTLAALSLSIRPNRETLLQVDLSTDSFLAALSPWILLPADGSAELHLYAKGKLNDFIGKEPTGSVKGLLRGSVTIEDTSMSPELLLERDWRISSSLELDKMRELHVSRISFRGDPGIHAKGDLVLTKELTLKESQLQLTVESLKKTGLVPLDGFFLAQLQSNEDTATLTFSAPEFTWKNLSIKNTLGRLNMHKEECAWRGAFDLNAKINEEKASVTSHLVWRPSDYLQISEITLSSPQANGSGNLTIYPDKKIEGELHSTLGNLHDFN